MAEFPYAEPDRLFPLQCELKALNGILLELRSVVESGRMAAEQLKDTR